MRFAILQNNRMARRLGTQNIGMKSAFGALPTQSQLQLSECMRYRTMNFIVSATTDIGIVKEVKRLLCERSGRIRGTYVLVARASLINSCSAVKIYGCFAAYNRIIHVI